MSEPILVTRQLSKQFDRFTAVNAIDLQDRTG
jgi:ABC-type branched-subunit amino acid transport system ATPase component